jgi:hypothetical protein
MAGTWTTISNAPPAQVETTFLLTDGSVLAQGLSTNQWYRLVPDAHGSYANGTWTTVASSVHAPLYYASGVLRDGRVMVVGGEYDAGALVWLLNVEVYDPVANTWTTLPNPPGWVRIGDAPGAVLPDGRFIVGQVSTFDVAIYDPATNAWTAAANKINRVVEESWSLLPDGTLHAVDCSNPPQAEKYVIAADTWVAAGQTPQVLVDSITEIGASVLLPDGRLFVIGATGFTALYTSPPIANQAGTWAQGPSIPQVNPGQALGAVDAPACILPNGNVLFSAGPITTPATFQAPAFFFEYDPTTNTIAQVPGPSTTATIPYMGRMLMLPTGQVMYTSGDTAVDLYTPSGGPDPVWLPTITTAPTTLRPGRTSTLAGRQINGLTQCSYYGNDATNATNYPIVRLRSTTSSHLWYCRTFDFSTMGLNTGTVVHTCRFLVPASVPDGTYCLEVVANGISSACRRVTVTRKWFKELKNEIKEKFEIIEVIKDLRDTHTKRVPDIVDDKLVREELDLFDRAQEEWVETIRTLAQGVDHANATMSRAFISPEQRPEVDPGPLMEPIVEMLEPRAISDEEAESAQDKRAFNDERREVISEEAAAFHRYLHSIARRGGDVDYEGPPPARTRRRRPPAAPDTTAQAQQRRTRRTAPPPDRG